MCRCRHGQGWAVCWKGKGVDCDIQLQNSTIIDFFFFFFGSQKQWHNVYYIHKGCFSPLWARHSHTRNICGQCIGAFLAFWSPPQCQSTPFWAMLGGLVNRDSLKFKCKIQLFFLHELVIWKWPCFSNCSWHNDVITSPILRSYNTITQYTKSPTLPRTQGTIAPLAMCVGKKATTNLWQSRQAIRFVVIDHNISKLILLVKSDTIFL